MTLDDILNEEISLFKPYKTRFGKYVPIPYKSSTIKEVLTSLRIYKDVTKRVKYIHDNYSSEKYKEVKGSSLISATFSAWFKKERTNNTEDKKLTHTIALDVDHIQDEQHLTVEYVKEKLMNLTGVYYCQCSASGNGVWALAAVNNPELREEIFEYYQKELKKQGIELDYLKDIARIRYLTYDENNIFKPNFNILVVHKKEEKQKFTSKKPASIKYNSDVNYNIIAATINAGLRGDNMKDWCSIGYHIAGVLGTIGESLFIEVSRLSQSFKSEKDCQYMYKRACKEGLDENKIAFFIKKLKELKPNEYKNILKGIYDKYNTK